MACSLARSLLEAGAAVALLYDCLSLSPPSPLPSLLSGDGSGGSGGLLFGLLVFAAAGAAATAISSSHFEQEGVTLL